MATRLGGGYRCGKYLARLTFYFHRTIFITASSAQLISAPDSLIIHTSSELRLPLALDSCFSLVTSHLSPPVGCNERIWPAPKTNLLLLRTTPEHRQRRASPQVYLHEPLLPEREHSRCVREYRRLRPLPAIEPCPCTPLWSAYPFTFSTQRYLQCQEAWWCDSRVIGPTATNLLPYLSESLNDKE